MPEGTRKVVPISSIGKIGREEISPLGHEGLKARSARAGPGREEISEAHAAGYSLPREELSRITTEINEAISIVSTRVTFEIQEDSGKVVIRVVDNLTGEVVRQIPPPEMLKVMTKLTELVGLLVDERK